MLVLTRKANQRITLLLPDGRSVFVEVVRVRGSHVRVGVEAPDDIEVRRTELSRPAPPDRSHHPTRPGVGVLPGRHP